MASTSSDCKPVTALTSHDFDRHVVWLVDLPRLEYATPAATFDNLETDEPYIALTDYLLHDGTVARGYCFIYDHTGFTLFSSNGTSILISDYSECSDTEAQNVARALGRAVEDIFPIHYRASFKVFGSLVEGDISVQSNPTLKRDALKRAP